MSAQISFASKNTFLHLTKFIERDVYFEIPFPLHALKFPWQAEYVGII